MNDETTNGDTVQQIAQHRAIQQAAALGLGRIGSVSNQIDPDWEARQQKQEQAYVRVSALEKAMQSFIQGDHPDADDIVARAKVFETYLLGDQS